jgi:hypothetical protein
MFALKLDQHTLATCGACAEEHRGTRSACERPQTHLEVPLRLALVDLYGEAVGAQRRGNDGVLVHVLQQHGGADGGPVVHAAAAVAMSARPVSVKSRGVAPNEQLR